MSILAIAIVALWMVLVVLAVLGIFFKQEKPVLVKVLVLLNIAAMAGITYQLHLLSNYTGM